MHPPVRAGDIELIVTLNGKAISGRLCSWLDNRAYIALFEMERSRERLKFETDRSENDFFYVVLQVATERAEK